MSHPLGYLAGSGAQTAMVTPLMWEMLGVSIAVTLIVAALVLWGVLRRRAREDEAAMAGIPLTRREGTRWIWIGVGISMVPLLVTLVWTVAVLAQIAPVPRNPRLTIDVTAQQWWWDANYSGASPDERFHTANEIHIPVGRPVLLKLASRDVIHSFWVPKLAGKMDLVPGQTNQTWIQANAPGVYRGQCAEFCGLQHAHMAFEIVADPPAQFEKWRSAQLQTAPPPATEAQARGLALVEYRCSLCHAVRGTSAGSRAAPDLTHLMSRARIAAGTLPNNRAALAGWIEDPQSAKPGALMPAQGLSAQQLNDVTDYLETLK